MSLVGILLLAALVVTHGFVISATRRRVKSLEDRVSGLEQAHRELSQFMEHGRRQFTKDGRTMWD